MNWIRLSESYYHENAPRDGVVIYLRTRDGIERKAYWCWNDDFDHRDEALRNWFDVDADLIEEEEEGEAWLRGAQWRDLESPSPEKKS
jgi:hypothetical protein